jgi:hypothetical protein
VGIAVLLVVVTAVQFDEYSSGDYNVGGSGNSRSA